MVGHMTESTWTPKIQITYVETKSQLADTLTKGNFTRDAICSISAFSARQAAPKRCLKNATRMAKSKPVSHTLPPEIYAVSFFGWRG